NVLLFFTRWITHFCAPTFVFLAGTSIYLQRLRGKSQAELSRFLITRGIWLIIVEFTIVRFSLLFNLDYHFFGLAEVIWIFGVSMIVLAVLTYLPVRVVGALGLAMIFVHNAFDWISVPPEASFTGAQTPTFLQAAWIFLHQPGFIPLFDGVRMFVAYPLIPWIGVMAAGYALGSVYSWDAEKRRRWLLRTGLVAIALFVILRSSNIYGDPSRWATQPTSLFTFLSFLNTTKYPASLLFLLMILGPSITFLGLVDRLRGKGLWEKIALTFGRVPLFYFILQMFYSHAVGVVLGYLAGKDVGYLFLNFPDFATQAPPDNGFPLWVVYLSWIVGLILLYPLCRWYGNLKRQSGHRLFSYL
ncbi:MAG: heparan-alpha-glucosaminide N-acetyltransferase domain-containing protein, partial [Acidobacteriota bacterium]